MTRLFYYKLIADVGAAPCVEDGLLSLAICKPMIRTSATVGDLVYGFAADSLDADNRLIYIARVTRKLFDGAYFTEPEYTDRADCIYERRGTRFRWRNGARFHGPNDIPHDLGPHPTYPRAAVLLSTDFRYLGRNGTAAYAARYPAINDALARLGRGHRVNHPDRLREELEQLHRDEWKASSKMVLGPASGGRRSRASHRSRSCGVVGASREVVDPTRQPC